MYTAPYVYAYIGLSQTTMWYVYVWLCIAMYAVYSYVLMCIAVYSYVWRCIAVYSYV